MYSLTFEFNEVSKHSTGIPNNQDYGVRCIQSKSLKDKQNSIYIHICEFHR